MHIGQILDAKDSRDVVTVAPQAGVRELIALLAEHNIGALIVSQDGRSLDGIVSERDVVRHLHHRGAALLADTVGSIMTGPVTTCTADDEVDALAGIMTERRIRHIPVVEEGVLTGIVSIGDVVKNRLDELEAHRSQLEAYIAG